MEDKEKIISLTAEEFEEEIQGILESLAVKGDDQHVIKELLKGKGKISDYYAAHYTSANTPRLMLASEEDNMMLQFDGDYMNDPEEGRYLVDVMISAAEASSHSQKTRFVEKLTNLRKSKLLYTAYKKATFLSCWTILKIKKGTEDISDSLNHWRFYGDDAKGACIMVPLKHLLNYFGDDLFKVSYGVETRGGGNKSEDRAVKRLEKALKERFNGLRSTPKLAIIDFDNLIKVTHPLLFLFKSSDYAAEEEVRSIIHKNDYSLKSEVFFMENKAFPENPKKAYIKGNKGLICDGSIIFFGPKSDEKYAIETMGLASELGKNIKVFISNKPYR